MKDHTPPCFVATRIAALALLSAARIIRDIALDQGFCKLPRKVAPLMFWLRECCALFVFASPLLVATLAPAADQPATPQPLAPAAKTVPAEPLYQESLRPQFHFTARYWEGYTIEPGADAAIPGFGGREGWINDVNGPIYFDGEYHLFAQRWWHCWLHAVSKDLVHWEELRPAFGQDEKFGGTQSGTCVIDYRNVSGLATGSTPVMIAFWSAGDNKRQCISYSSDHGRTWTKYDKNPVLEHPYRDPKVFWHEPSQKWIMVLCGPPDFHYFILTSSNLLRWEEQSKIPDMYECPDMFPLPVDGDTTKTKWVIVNGDGQYLVGDFDGREFKPLTGEKRCEWGEVGDATLHATRGRASAGLGETGLGAAASTASAHPPIPGSSARNRT